MRPLCGWERHCLTKRTISSPLGSGGGEQVVLKPALQRIPEPVHCWCLALVTSGGQGKRENVSRSGIGQTSVARDCKVYKLPQCLELGGLSRGFRDSLRL